MLTALIWMVPAQQVPQGTWLFGVAAILIGINVVRYVNDIGISGFSLVLGFLALIGALGQVWRVDLPFLAICLFIIGASLVAKPWLTRTDRVRLAAGTRAERPDHRHAAGAK